MRQITVSFLAACALATLVSAQWTRVGGGLPTDYYAEDVFVADNGMVFTTGKGGIYRSDDGGTSWSIENNNLGTLFGGDPGPFRIVSYPEVTLVGTNGKSGVYRSTDRGENWSAPSNIPTEGVGFYDFIQADSDTYLATKRENVVGNSGVWVSLDRGANWERRSDGLTPIAYIPGHGGIIPVEAVAVDGIFWYAAVNGKGVFRSSNEGLGWEAINNGITINGTVVGAIAETSDVVAHDGLVMAIVDQQLFVSQDGGDHWRQAAANFGFRFGDIDEREGVFYISAFGADNRVFVTEDGLNFRTTVGTSESVWRRADPISAAADAIYIADGYGLWRLSYDASDLLDLAPVITALQGGGVFFTDFEVTLAVEADGTGPLTYQWRKDGVDIAGATGTTFTIANTTLDDSGDYTVVVTGPGGSLTSSTLTVEIVDAKPGIPDPAYNFFGAFSALSSSLRNTQVPLISEAVVQSDGHVWVAGGFRRSQGLTGTTDSDYIALKRLNPDGTVATVPTLSYEGVHALALEADDSLIAATHFGKVVRYHPDGSLAGVIALARNGSGNGALHDVLILPDGRILLVGTFNTITDADGNNPISRQSVALLNADGSVDLSFDAGTNTQATLAAYDPDREQVYIGGPFTQWNGDRTHRSIVRLNLDGSHDTSFLVNGGLSNNFGAAALLVQPDGKLVIGTVWNYLGRYLERLLTDGSLDDTFNVGGTGPNARPYQLLQNPDGSFYASGRFTAYNGQAKNYVVALTQDGAFQTNFNPGGAGPLQNSSEAGALALSPDGAFLYIGMDGYSYQTAEENIVFNTPAYPQDTFIRVSNAITNLALVGHPENATVNAGDTATFEVRAFSSSAESYQWRFNGEPITGATDAILEIANAQVSDEGYYDVVVTNGSGSLTSKGAILLTLAEPKFTSVSEAQDLAIGDTLVLNVNAVGQGELTYQWFKDGLAIDGATHATLSTGPLAPGDAGLYYVEVTNTLGTTASAPIPVTVELVGGVADTRYATGLSTAFGLGTAKKLLAFADGSALIAGSFNRHAGLSDASYLAKFKPDGTFDDTFPANGKPMGQVWAMLRQADGKVVIGGFFTAYDGHSALAKIARINADGTLDDTFTPAAINGNVQALAVQSDGKILVGGTLTTVGGVALGHLARLNSDGALDTSFNAGETGLNQAVHVLAVDSRDRIIAGGGFNSFNEESIGNVVRFTPDGLLDPSFNNSQVSNGGYSTVILDMKVLADDRVVLVGSFGNFGGVTGASKAIILGTDGELDRTFPLQPTAGNITSVDQLADGSLVFAGSFADWKGSTVNGMVVTDTNGTLTTDFALRFGTTKSTYGPSYISALDASQLGYGLIAGDFTKVGEHETPGLAKVYFDPIGLAITRQPEHQFITAGTTARFTVQAVGTSDPVYQWFKDGVRIAGEDTNTLTIPDASASDIGRYSARVFNASGNQFSDDALLRILGAPAIISQSRDFTASAGGGAILSAEVIGLAPLTYQWSRDGTAISGATESTLTLTGLASTDAGLYTLTATNGEGSATTTEIPVNVEFGDGGVNLSFNAELPYAGTIGKILPYPTGGYLARTTSQLPGATSPYLAKLNAKGAIDDSFSPVLPASTSGVWDMWVRPDGRILLSGSFGYIDFVAYKTRYLHLIEADGAESTIELESPSYAAKAVHCFSDNSFLVVGAVDGGSVYDLRKYEADGTIDTSFPALTADGRIDYAAFAPDGSLVILGAFTTVNDQPRNHVAVIEADGTLRSHFLPTADVVVNAVRSVAISPTGEVYIGGTSGAVSGRRLGRLKADGSFDDTFGPVPIGGTSTNYARIDEIHLLPSGQLLLSAYRFSFYTASPADGGVPYSWNIARLNADGSVDAGYDLGGGIKEYELADLSPLPSGGFLASGNFTSIGGENRTGLALFNGDAEPRTLVATSDPVSEPAEGSPLQLAAAGYGLGPLTFQWYRNGIPVAEGDAALLTIAAVSARDLGDYTVVLTDAVGRTTSSPISVTSSTLGETFAKFVADLPEGLRGADDDGDGNGWPNAWDYAFASDQTSGRVRPLVSTATGEELGLPGDTRTYLTVLFRHREGTRDLRVSPRSGHRFDALDVGDCQMIGTPTASDGATLYTYRSTLPIEDNPSVLIELQIEIER